MPTHVFVGITHGIIIPVVCNIFIPMYTAHPYFFLKTLGKNVCITHGKIQYI